MVHFEILTCSTPLNLSVLGPILFVLFTADIIALIKDFNLSVDVFADDIYGACPTN